MQTATLNSFACCERKFPKQASDSTSTVSHPGQPAVCPDCKALFRCGRWQWASYLPYDAQEEVCQACRRIHDGCPAGVVRLQGEFVRHHKTELIELARQHEQREKRSHPTHRILAIKDNLDELLIETTDVQLPRRIANAIRRAHRGELEMAGATNTSPVQINWTR